MKRLAPWLMLLVLGGAALFLFYRAETPAPTAWYGYAEADYVDVSPVTTGRLTSLFVTRGQRVLPGAPLFEQDETDQRAALEGARASLAQAQAKLADLLAPQRPDQIAAATAALAQARATRDRIAGDVARDSRIVGSGSVTRQKLDQEKADLAGAEAGVRAAAAQLALARRPTGRADAIAADRAAVAAARAAVAEAAWSLAQRRVAAPVAAVVADTPLRAGETASAGATVVQLLPPANIRLRFFVPEADLPRLRYGTRVAVHCDGCGPGLWARVSFVSPQSEYTPPVIYSAESRAKLVFMIEATPPAAEALRFKPGEPVTIDAYAQ